MNIATRIFHSIKNALMWDNTASILIVRHLLRQHYPVLIRKGNACFAVDLNPGSCDMISVGETFSQGHMYNRYIESLMSDTSGEFTFVDFGANIGAVTVYAGNLAREARRKFCAFSVEMNPLNVSRIYLNLELSNLVSDCHILNAAIYSSD